MAAAPLTHAHIDGSFGYPKPYCEDAWYAGDTDVHDYGAPAPGFFMFAAIDGSSLDPLGANCPYSPEWDGHYEYGNGGTWLLACDTGCGASGLGGGAQLCWETYADHAEFPTLRVVDASFVLAGYSLPFFVYADRINNMPVVDPAQPECGDFESDESMACVDFCGVPFGAGLDGSYQVYPTGTNGHVIDTGAAAPACSDGVDNDGDGHVDYPADPGCDYGSDGSESPDPACSDGADNDGDGYVDYPADPGCGGTWDRTEDSDPPRCSDGRDNDGDLAVDWPNDAGCASPLDETEEPTPACFDGVDNDGDGKTDHPNDPQCASPYDESEHATQCSDGINNDGDIWVDWPADPQCASPEDDSEAS